MLGALFRDLEAFTFKTDNLPQGTSSSSLKVKSNGFSMSELQGALPDGEKPLLIVDDKEFSGCYVHVAFQFPETGCTHREH